MESNKERVLVAGANGTTGKIIVELLDQSQYFSPVAMVRKEEQMAQFQSNGIDAVLGDLEKDLSKQVQNVDKVIFAAGSGGNTSDQKTIDVDQEGAKNIIDASKNADIKKFVMLSSIRADEPESGGKLETYLRAKKVADEHLRASGLNYAIVRPGALKNEAAQGKIKVAEKLDELGDITRADVAQTLVAVLNDDVANKKTFEMIQGDTVIGKALDKLSA